MLTKKLNIHFIGIGGIGVSALARYYLEKGYQVSGSDLVSSEITQALKKKGAKIFVGKHRGKNLPKDTDLIIYSPAVQQNNPELKEATYRGLTPVSYPQALGELTKKHFTIAVCGSHGKTSTSAALAYVLWKGNKSPNAMVGALVPQFSGSALLGKSQICVAEADEYANKLRYFKPFGVILSSIDYDHPDYFKDLKLKY